jgi:ribosome assembly protein SQT1
MSDEYEEIEINDMDDLPSDDGDSVEMDENEEEEQQNPNDTSFFSFRLPDSVLCVATNPKNSLQVSVGCLDNSGKLFSVDWAGAPLSSQDLLGHTDSVVAVKYSADGQYVATGSYDSTVRIWSALNGALLTTIDETGSEIEVMAFHPRENVLVAGCSDGSVWVWSIDQSEAIMRHMLRGHSHGSAVRTLNFLGKDHQGLLSTSDEGIAIVWNLKSGQIVHKSKPLNEGITSATVHPTKPIYAIGLENGAAYVLHAETGKILHKVTANGSIESVTFSACGFLLALATLEGILEIWSVEQLGGYPRHKIDLAARLAAETGEQPTVEIGFTKLVWHPDSSLRCLISAGKSGRIDLWNAMTGEHIADLPGHEADVMDLTVSMVQDPQGRQVARIVSVCDEGFVKMFSVSQDSD